MEQQPEAAYCGTCGRPDDRLSRACPFCSQLRGAPDGVRIVGFGIRLVAYILDAILIWLTLFIGYLIWWLIVLQYGQTPGKQLVGIRVIRVDGSRSDWGLMFLREFAVKWLLFSVVAGYTTGGIVWLLNYLWPLWDTDHQALHDKIVGTLVVETPPGWSRTDSEADFVSRAERA